MLAVRYSSVTVAVVCAGHAGGQTSIEAEGTLASTTVAVESAEHILGSMLELVVVVGAVELTGRSNSCALIGPQSLKCAWIWMGESVAEQIILSTGHVFYQVA